MSPNEHIFDPSALGPDDRPDERAPEELVEVTLRPANLDQFIGQERVVGNLRIALQAAKQRDEPPEHVLFSGPPGLGKTSLARVIAAEVGSQLHATSGPALERPKDLVGLLTQLQRGDVFFIDEVHRIPAAVEEYLYTAMEDFTIDFTLEQGAHARMMSLSLKPFTLIGATTREGLLSAPFRARFGHLERLTPYPTADLVRIVTRAAGILGVEIEPAAAQLLASRARGTPRIANRFLRWARDLVQVSGAASLDEDLASEALARHGVDEHGLEDMDRRILGCLARAGNLPVGIKTIAASVGETEDTIEEVFEPHLLRKGFLHKTARGRLITPAGMAIIGSPSEGGASAPQPELF